MYWTFVGEAITVKVALMSPTLWNTYVLLAYTVLMEVKYIRWQFLFCSIIFGLDSVSIVTKAFTYLGWQKWNIYFILIWILKNKTKHKKQNSLSIFRIVFKYDLKFILKLKQDAGRRVNFKYNTYSYVNLFY